MAEEEDDDRVTFEGESRPSAWVRHLRSIPSSSSYHRLILDYTFHHVDKAVYDVRRPTHALKTRGHPKLLAQCTKYNEENARQASRIIGRYDSYPSRQETISRGDGQLCVLPSWGLRNADSLWRLMLWASFHHHEYVGYIYSNEDWFGRLVEYLWAFKTLRRLDDDEEYASIINTSFCIRYLALLR